jgi:ARG/rhodanese/phosphatase superfamily protein
MAVAFPQVRIGEPVRFKTLSVFPLFTEPKGSVDYVLADEAIRDQLLTVEEVSEAGSVPELLVENKGDFRVLFIEGEELVGAKQNRVLNTSILVAAKSRTKIPVSCVEQGRWRFKSKFFGSSGSHSPSKLRYALKKSVSSSLQDFGTRDSDQGQVWHEVGAMHATHRVESTTAAMSDAFDAYKDRVAEFREQLKYVDGATGMAVVIGGKVVGCDLFDKPSTCRKVWDRLISGLVFDTLSAREAADAPADRSSVDQLLETTSHAAWQSTEPIGEGDEYRAELVHGEQASALTFHDSLVHGSVLVGA